jgi:hypothetical protein
MLYGFGSGKYFKYNTQMYPKLLKILCLKYARMLSLLHMQVFLRPADFIFAYIELIIFYFCE